MDCSLLSAHVRYMATYMDCDCFERVHFGILRVIYPICFNTDSPSGLNGSCVACVFSGGGEKSQMCPASKTLSL